jgi:hypothetical protein
VDIEYAKILLDILIENSARILRAGFGINSVEHVFFEVIELIRKHTELKCNMLKRVEYTLLQNDSGLLNEGMVPQELIELIAHEMQWTELRDLAEKRVQDKFHGDWTFAVSDISRKIIDAQSNNWEGREFYKHFRVA